MSKEEMVTIHSEMYGSVQVTKQQYNKAMVKQNFLLGGLVDAVMQGLPPKDARIHAEKLAKHAMERWEVENNHV